MLTTLLLKFGFTRDDAIWFWGRLVSAAALIGTGLVDLSAYLGPREIKAAQVLAVLVLWLSGKYDNSSLPGKR